MARVALYIRVSTDKQTTDNQELELTAWATRCGHTVTKVYADQGLSGAKSSAQRPAMSAMLKGAIRHEFDILAAWSIDRIGRSLSDLLNTLALLQASKVELFLHQQAIDTSTHAGKALFSMCGVFAEFEREIIRERINSGIARARTKGTKSGKAFGRPGLCDASLEAVKAALAVPGASVRSVAAATGVSIGKVAGLRRELVEA